MDIMQTTALPETDYKNGKLRTVRGRMLKKLFKYEWKVFLPALIICGSILAGLTLFICFFSRTGVELLFSEDPNAPIMNYPATTVLGAILTLVLYMVTLTATVFVPFGVSINRYHKNFFKEEGYLTFSIPASMEEQILAKHLSGMLATLLSMAASVLSVLLVVLCISVNGEPLPPVTEPVVNPVSEFFLGLEGLILGIEIFVAIFTVSGALTCWEQKFMKKSQIFLRVFLGYIAFMVLETIYVFFVEFGVFDFFYTTLVGAHVWNVLKILFVAGIITFSVWYELRVLKTKLNLK